MLVTIRIEDLAPIPYSIIPQQTIRNTFLRRYPNGVAVLNVSNPGEFLATNPLMRYYAGLTSVGLPALHIKDYKFEGNRLSCYRLNGLAFDRCRFDTVRFNKARLEDVVWCDCDFTRTFFYSARLTGAVLTNCSLSHTVFKDACLHSAMLTDCRFTAVDFRDSALHAAKVLNCRFDNCQGVPDRLLRASHRDLPPLAAVSPKILPNRFMRPTEFRTQSIDVVF